jgi:hypothetical protein
MVNPSMSPAPFTSRSTGVLFWGAGYLVAAIAWGLTLAALWPQGTACTATCGQRIEAGGIAILLLAAGGTAGFAVAIWLGVSRRATAPHRLTLALLVLLIASLVTAVMLKRAGSAHDESGGLATVRSAWSWGLAVPTSALLVTTVAAGARAWLRTRRARPVASARVRRA